MEHKSLMSQRYVVTSAKTRLNPSAKRSQPSVAANQHATRLLCLSKYCFNELERSPERGLNLHILSQGWRGGNRRKDPSEKPISGGIVDPLRVLAFLK